MVNQIVLILSALFSIVGLLNIFLPDYYDYIVRYSSSQPVKYKGDIFFIMLMFIEVVYILIGFTSNIPIIFMVLMMIELGTALFINITNYRNYIIYQFVFLTVNLTIFTCLMLY